MSGEQNTPESTPSNLPEEPEIMRLWRLVIAEREALCREIQRWESPDNPIAAYYAKVAEVHGSHGLSDWSLRENEEQAREQARRLRARLNGIDWALKVGTRDKDDPYERGITVTQLRELLERPEEAQIVELARAAFEAWWEDRGNLAKAARAREWLSRIRRPRSADPIDLQALHDEDKGYRRKYKSLPSGAQKHVITRILKRLQGERVK